MRHLRSVWTNVPGCLLFALLIQHRGCHAAVTQCNTGNFFGQSNPGGNENEKDDITGVGFLMLDDSVHIDCCGVAEEWTARIQYRTDGDTIYFQIWRPVSGGYELVGQTMYTPCCSANDITVTLTQPYRYTVKSGDVIGWYTAGLDMVKYDYNNGNNNRDINLLYTGLLVQTVGSTVNWVATATQEDNRDYGIRFDVEPNTTPTFTNLPGSTTIANSVGSTFSLVTFTASDIDTSDVSAGLTWDWVSNSQFSFDPATQLLETGTLLGAPSTQKIEITVADQCENTATSTYIVTITNTAPTLSGLPAAVTVSEDETSQTLLYTITCTDTIDTVSSDFDNATKALGYPFVVQQIPATSNYGVYNTASPGFDYDTKITYTMTVECTDGYSSNTGVVNVYLLENASPNITNLQAATSVSISASIGYSVFNITTTDAEGDTLTYTYTCDPSPCPFQVMASGEVVTTQVMTGITVVGYDVSITVSDGRNTVGPSILTITMADINSPVTISNLPLASSQSVSEDTAAGTSLYSVSYSDVDAGQTHIYSMSAGGSGVYYFQIDAASGVVSTKNLLDYEALAIAGELSFPLSITISDGATSDTQTLEFHVINVNDAPSFSQSSYSISADEGSAGTVIGSPSYNAVDPDTGDSLSYTGNCGAYTSYFYFNPSDGSVTYQSDYDLDVTSPPPTTHACTVTVADSGGATATASLMITIANINDNSPIFTPAAYSMFVDYYASVTTTVGTVTASDGDAGTYGSFTYSLNQSSLGLAYFAIDSNGNIVTLLDPSGIGMGVTEAVTAIATDTGGLSATAAITVVVSETTTTSTTTTTDRYLTFLEDSSSIGWLVACCFAAVAFAGVITGVVYTCRGPNGWGSFWRLCCPRRRIHNSRRRLPPTPSTRRTAMSSARTELPPIQEGHVRPPPPATEAMHWRSEMGEKEERAKFGFWRNNDFMDGSVICKSQACGSLDCNAIILNTSILFI